MKKILFFFNFKILNKQRISMMKEKLHIWPRNGNMLGGQEVNITGPCFEKTQFLCKWGDGYDAPITHGEVTYVWDPNPTKLRGKCIQPLMFYNGRLNLSLSIDNGSTWGWKSEFNIG